MSDVLSIEFEMSNILSILKRQTSAGKDILDPESISLLNWKKITAYIQAILDHKTNVEEERYNPTESSWLTVTGKVFRSILEKSDAFDPIEEFSEVETSSSIPSKVRETLELSWLNLTAKILQRQIHIKPIIISALSLFRSQIHAGKNILDPGSISFVCWQNISAYIKDILQQNSSVDHEICDPIGSSWLNVTDKLLKSIRINEDTVDRMDGLGGNDVDAFFSATPGCIDETDVEMLNTQPVEEVAHADEEDKESLGINLQNVDVEHPEQAMSRKRKRDSTEGIEPNNHRLVTDGKKWTFQQVSFFKEAGTIVRRIDKMITDKKICSTYTEAPEYRRGQEATGP